MEEEWEMIQKSNTDLVSIIDSSHNSPDFHGTQADSTVPFEPNYFALDSHNHNLKSPHEDDQQEKSSVESDNPSWVDPQPKFKSSLKNSASSWTDSSSDDGKFESDRADFDKKDKVLSNFDVLGSKDPSFGGFGEIQGLGFANNAKGEVGFQATGVKHETCEEFDGLEGENELGFDEFVKTRANFEDERERVEFCEVREKPISVKEVKPDGFGAEKKRVVWWKMPLELMKFCAFRISPVWSFSVAAAVVGFVILGRRLYKLKQKSNSMPLKYSIDDKKVSQFMSRAARLNEAFSVVKRSPIIRASMPAAGGVTPWPVMSLR